MKIRDNTYFRYYLDFISVIGKPGQNISSYNYPPLDNITITFQQWAAPYSAKYVDGIDFDLTGRTFRIGVSSTRAIWFIIMHPTEGENSEFPHSAHERRKKTETQAQNSGMPRELASELGTYIIDVFQTGDLLQEGVEYKWEPGSDHKQNMTAKKWATFQNLATAGYITWANTFGQTSFWRRHRPAFHAYDYGANIKLDYDENISNIPAEIQELDPRVANEDLDETDNGSSGASPDPDDENNDGDGTNDDATDDRDEEMEDEEYITQTQRRAQTDANYDELIKKDDKVAGLIKALESRYNLDNVGHVSYALATCISIGQY